MKKIILFIFLVFVLPSVSADHVSEHISVFGATLVEQSPPVVPAIALEHRSNARVKLFYEISPLTIGNVEYEIEDINFRPFKSNPYITGIREDKIAERISENLDYESYFTFGDSTIAVANIDLRKIGSGRHVVITDETADKICSGEINESKEIGENIPNEINVSLRVDVRFKACRGGFDRNKETKKITGCPAGYLTQRDYNNPDAYESEVQFLINRCQLQREDEAKREELRGNTKLIERLEEDKKRCVDTYTRIPKTLTDSIDVDAVIGVDKTNIDHLTNPEKLKDRICNVKNIREHVQSWINKTEKAESFFQSTCVAGVLGAAGQFLFQGDVCDAKDTLSLGCDWIFCPAGNCVGGVNPMGSIIAGTTMCWENRGFYDKDLGFVLEDEWAKSQGVLVGNPAIESNDGKSFVTYDKKLTINEKGERQYTSSFCSYPLDEKGNQDYSHAKIRVPHYACVTGVKANLVEIDKQAEQYQECLIKARQGGTSVGFCDKIRSYYLCDRVLGEALPFFGQGGTQGLIGKFFNRVGSVVLDPILLDKTEEYFENRRDGARLLAQQTISEYGNVPFIQLVGRNDRYLRTELCKAFVDGNLFSLEKMKEQFNLLKVDYPDSATITTERRVWDYYKVKSDELKDSGISKTVYNLPEGERNIHTAKILMAALIAQESSWDKNTPPSRTGVKGLAQITELTSKECSEIGSYEDILESEKKSIECGTKVLYNKAVTIRKVIERAATSEEKVKLILAAYNSGEELVFDVTGKTSVYDWDKIKKSSIQDSLLSRGKNHDQVTVDEKSKYPNSVLSWYYDFNKCEIDANNKLINCPDRIKNYVGEYNKFEEDLENAVIQYKLADKIGEFGFDSGQNKVFELTKIKDIVVGNDGGILAPAEYSYDVFYQIYSTKIDPRTGSGAGAYKIYLTELTSSVPGVNCGGVINIAQGTLSSDEMILDNVFKVHQCKANQQCLQFKGRTICRNIGETLTISDRQVDALGLSLFGNDDNNKDGISDTWCSTHFSLQDCSKIISDDTDGDKYCNAQEYLKTTNPRDKKNFPTGEAPDCSAALDVIQFRANQEGGSLYPSGPSNLQQQGLATDEEGNVLTPLEVQTEELIKNLPVKLYSVTAKGEFQSNKLKGLEYYNVIIDEKQDVVVNQGGEYRLSAEFESDLIDSSWKCMGNVYVENLRGNIWRCGLPFALVRVYGDETDYTIKLYESSTPGAKVYEFPITIVNNEPEASGEKLVACRVEGNVDELTGGDATYTLFYINPEFNGEHRCSDYTFDSETAYHLGIFENKEDLDKFCQDFAYDIDNDKESPSAYGCGLVGGPNRDYRKIKLHSF